MRYFGGRHSHAHQCLANGSGSDAAIENVGHHSAKRDCGRSGLSDRPECTHSDLRIGCRRICRSLQAENGTANHSRSGPNCAERTAVRLKPRCGRNVLIHSPLSRRGDNSEGSHDGVAYARGGVRRSRPPEPDKQVPERGLLWPLVPLWQTLPEPQDPDPAPTRRRRPSQEARDDLRPRPIVDLSDFQAAITVGFWTGADTIRATRAVVTP